MQASRLRWNLEHLAHRAVEAALALLPPAAAFRFGSALGDLAWHLFPSRRRVVLRNLRIAFAGEPLRGGIESTARDVFRRSGANLVFSLRSGTMTEDETNRCVDLGDLSEVHGTLRSGRGVILLIPHMGNWELLTQVTHITPPGVPRGAHYRPLNNPVLDKHVHAQRAEQLHARGHDAFAARLVERRRPLVEHEDGAAALGDADRRRQADGAGADDQHVAALGHGTLAVRSPGTNRERPPSRAA